MIEIELKSCPFCGDQPEQWFIEDIGHAVGCQNQQCVAPHTEYLNSHAEAAVQWNCRQSLANPCSACGGTGLQGK